MKSDMSRGAGSGSAGNFKLLILAGEPFDKYRTLMKKLLLKNVFIKEEGKENAPALKIPVAHGEGRFFAEDTILKDLEKNHQIIYRYCDAEGNTTQESNPNGATQNIAGICNKERTVFGMMPHPERATGQFLGNEDGKNIFGQLFGIN